MSRLKGSLNKPKFMSVSLEDLQRVFHPNALIKVDINYKPLFETGKAEVFVVPKEEKSEGSNIEMVVS